MLYARIFLQTGASSLFLAAQIGDLDTVRLLIRSGAVVDQPNLVWPLIILFYDSLCLFMKITTFSTT